MLYLLFGFVPRFEVRGVTGSIVIGDGIGRSSGVGVILTHILALTLHVWSQIEFGLLQRGNAADGVTYSEAPPYRIECVS